VAHITEFQQTRTVEVLDVTDLEVDGFTEFLTGTGFKVTRRTPLTGGILHEVGRSLSSSHRRMFSPNAYLVKVDGVLADPVSRALFASVYPNLTMV
jgi:hypothetical protein